MEVNVQRNCATESWEENKADQYPLLAILPLGDCFHFVLTIMRALLPASRAPFLHSDENK